MAYNKFITKDSTTIPGFTKDEITIQAVRSGVTCHDHAGTAIPAQCKKLVAT